MEWIRERRLPSGEILWHRPQGKKAEELEIADTLAFLEQGKLGVRANDDAASKPLFHLVPDMLVGDTAVMDLIDAEDGRGVRGDRRRTACVYAIDAGTVVREYEPERLRDLIRRGEYRFALSLLRTLLAHAAVNFRRLRYGNERDEIVRYAAIAGLTVSRMQAEEISLAYLERWSWDDFKRLFVLLYQHREYSRLIYDKLGKYTTGEGIAEATNLFRHLFQRNREDDFPRLLAALLEDGLAPVIRPAAFWPRTGQANDET